MKLDSSDIAPTTSSAAEPAVFADNVASVDASVTSEVDLVPEVASTLTDIVQNIPPPPLQFGDFSAMGLTGISPAGIIRWSFEIINVTSGMPWFWTIVAGSVFWRLVCVPLTLKAARTAAIMQPHQKELTALQERIKQSSSTQNALELMKANRALKEFYTKLGISPFGGVLGLLQVPVTLGMFFAVKKMCDLPVEHLKFSGFEMYPDLTAIDPTMTLPIVMTVAVNLQLLASSYFPRNDFSLMPRLDFGEGHCPKSAANVISLPFPYSSWVFLPQRLPRGKHQKKPFARYYSWQKFIILHSRRLFSYQS